MVKLRKYKYFKRGFNNYFEQKQRSKMESDINLEFPTTNILLKKQHTLLRLGPL